MIVPLRSVRNNSPAEMEAFERVCDTLAGFDAALDAEWADGFLHALASGPHLPALEKWLPALCGDAFERAFADPPSAAQAQRALLVRLKVICEQLDPAALLDDGHSMRLDPLMSEWDDAMRAEMVQQGTMSAEDAALLQTGALWAQGFFEGVEAFQDLWLPPADEDAATTLALMLESVAALMLAADSADYAAFLASHHNGRPAPTRDDLLADACYSVQDLRVFWVDHALRPTTRRVAAVPGRNEPCPCGSGRKYKKCHGAAA